MLAFPFVIGSLCFCALWYAGVAITLWNAAASASKASVVGAGMRSTKQAT